MRIRTCLSITTTNMAAMALHQDGASSTNTNMATALNTMLVERLRCSAPPRRSGRIPVFVCDKHVHVSDRKIRISFMFIHIYIYTMLYYLY